MRNLKVVLAARPQGMPTLADFRLEEAPIPSPADGQLLIRARYLSADPLQRVRMNDSSTYGMTIPIGDTVWGRMVGEVVESRNPNYKTGEFVEGMLGWQTYALSDGREDKAEYAPGLTRVDPALAPISTALGIMGMPGVTAFFAMREICAPKPGETVVVSAAAGMVGSLAAQIAKVMGARVVGLAGEDRKVNYLLDELGLDAAINYRTTPDLAAALRAACPDGIDGYYDNVGGPIRDIILTQLRRWARIALVGRIASMNTPGAPALVPDPQVPLMHARAMMKGFIVYDYEHRLDECRTTIAGWVKSGQIKYHEDVADGIENAAQSLIDVLNGRNIGKAIIKMA